MKKIALLDTGVITAFYSKNPDSHILALMDAIKMGTIEGRVLRPTLVEIYSHLCKLPGGITLAESTVASFLKEYTIKIIPMDNSIAFKAGMLKCQHRARLSNVDCIEIAHALNDNIEFHTTEKKLHEILPKLKIKTYSF